jgi:hypothetical protein
VTSHREGKTMRKLLSATAICLLAGSVAVSATAMGKGPKAPPKQAAGTLSILATPSTLGAADATTTVTGNLKSNSSCRKDRIVRFSYTGTGGTTQLGETTETRSNGNFTAVLPRPTDTAPATVTLQVDVDQADRKVGSKKKGKKQKKGRKITCLAASGQTTLTLVP